MALFGIAALILALGIAFYFERLAQHKFEKQPKHGVAETD